MNKKALISFYEVVLSLTLIGLFYFFFPYDLGHNTDIESSHDIESFLHSYNFDDEERRIIFNESFEEDLRLVVNEDWTGLNDSFRDNLGDMSLYLDDGSYKKEILECEGAQVSRQRYTRVLFNKEEGLNADKGDYRIIHLEVCR